MRFFKFEFGESINFSLQGYEFKSGESIADRIMKIVKNGRNANEIDDRPRRRMNTGDIIKSRRILN